MFRKLLLTLLCLAYLPVLFGQEPVYKNITEEEGLPSNEVYKVFEDSKGFLWFLTDRGVSRYDGTLIETFTTTEGLSENTIFSIDEGEDKKLWFGCYTKGVSYFENEQFRSFKHNEALTNQFSSTEILGVIEKNKNVLVYSSRGIFDVDSLGKVNKLDFSNQAQGNVIIINTKNNDIHFGASDRFYLADFILFNETRIPFPQNANDLQVAAKSGISVRLDVIQKNEYEYYLVYGNCLILINTNTKEAKLVKAFDQKINRLWLNKKGELWVALVNYGGLIKYNPSDFQQPIISLLKGKSVTSVIEDREGGVWASTIEKGVFHFPSDHVYSFGEDDIPEPQVKHVIGPSSNRIIFQNQKGNLFTYKNGQLEVHTPNNFNNRTEQRDLSLVDDKVYVGFTNIGCYLFTEDNNFIYKNNYPGGNDIKRLNDSLIIIGSSGGFTILKESLRVYLSHKEGFSVRVNDLQVGNEIAHLATNKGLFTFDFKTKKYFDYASVDPLFGSRINAVVKKGDFYIAGSLGDGLLIYNENGLINHITHKKDKIVNDFCNHLFLDDKGRVWVSTTEGLSCVFLNNHGDVEHVNNYTRKDGLIGKQVNESFVRNDTVWIATNKGLSFFKVNPNPVVIPPLIYLSEISINNEVVQLSDSLNLSYSQKALKLGFRGISTKSKEKLFYEYRLKGSDSDWTKTKSRYVSFPSLSPGEYSFEVRSVNYKGVRSENTAALNFVIAAPFWQTPWFIICVFLVFGLLVLAVARNRISQLKKKNTLIEDLHSYKQQALSSQMNPHFIFNSLNSIQKFIIANDKKESNKYLAKFSKLMRLVLDNSRERLISIDDELEALSIYLELEALRYKERMNYKIDIDPDVDASIYQIPPLLLQPYVENSIWHGLMHKQDENGLITIRLKTEGEFILFEIEDNGVGRAKAMAIKAQKNVIHKSAGMSITEKRIELGNELYKNDVSVQIIDLKDEMNNPTGTKVEIKLPLIQRKND